MLRAMAIAYLKCPAIFEGERRSHLRKFGAVPLQALQKLDLPRVINVVKRNSENVGDDRTSSLSIALMQDARIGGSNRLAQEAMLFLEYRQIFPPVSFIG